MLRHYNLGFWFYFCFLRQPAKKAKNYHAHNRNFIRTCGLENKLVRVIDKDLG